MFPIRDHNSSETTPYVTIGLIFVNVVLLLLTAPWGGGMEALWEDLALYPVAVMNGSNRTRPSMSIWTTPSAKPSPAPAPSGVTDDDRDGAAAQGSRS